MVSAGAAQDLAPPSSSGGVTTQAIHSACGNARQTSPPRPVKPAHVTPPAHADSPSPSRRPRRLTPSGASITRRHRAGSPGAGAGKPWRPTPPSRPPASAPPWRLRHLHVPPASVSPWRSSPPTRPLASAPPWRPTPPACPTCFSFTTAPVRIGPTLTVGSQTADQRAEYPAPAGPGIGKTPRHRPHDAKPHSRRPWQRPSAKRATAAAGLLRGHQPRRGNVALRPSSAAWPGHAGDHRAAAR